VSDPVRIRPATPTDLDTAIVDIEHRSQPSPWSKALFLDELAHPAARVLTLEAGGEVCGFICYRLLFEEAELLNVAVAPSVRRSGYGERLVEAMLADARAHGVTRVVLEVRASNEGAIRLYERKGFACVGRRAAYYRDNGEDALVLGLSLEPSRVE
jgi:ribosomal-protein-alanine N-acetyltransferase